MIRNYITFLLLLLTGVMHGADMRQYNVVWDAPSKDAKDSMPLAGGILGLNVWAQDGDICFLMASPNCMDANGMQTKLGLVKLRFAPAIFEKEFRQELRLGQSEIQFQGKAASGAPVSVKLWCVVDRPVVHVETSAGEAVNVTVTYETWSDFQAIARDGVLKWSRRQPDVNVRRQKDLAAQGMKELSDKVPDPLSRLTSGGRMTAAGMKEAGSGTGTFNGMKTNTCALKTAAPIKQLDLCITLRMEQDKSQSEWDVQLDKDAKRAAQNAATDRRATQVWWDAFWNRSHIIVKPGASETDPVWQAGRNYQLIRYMSASNVSGRAMTLFNGGSFTCTGNPDARAWDGCQFMAQNQRLVYWPMLRAGDFDLLKVATDFYRDRTEMRRLHARKFWGVEGLVWPEPLSIFGLDAIGTTADGRSTPSHLHYHYISGMEFALMMLEFQRYTGRTFPGYTEGAKGIIRYYDEYYQKANAKKTGKPLDDKGCLVIYPSDACEPYHGCTNNTDVIAGLTALSRELLAQGTGAISPQERTYLEGFLKRLPPFPMKEIDGRKFFAAAESWEWVFSNGNMCFPQMYVCFPFNILSLGRSDMSLAKNTWDLSPINPAVQHQNQCWYQSAINMARMGETVEAARYTIDKLRFPGERFPTFYHVHYSDGRGGFCQVPDADHGGAAMIALQEMIMQVDGKRILLGGAWPAQWNASFKLHAPYQTVVEGRVAEGKVVVEKVTPESRRKDVEIFPLKEAPMPLSEGKLATASSNYGPGYDAAKAFDGQFGTRWGSVATARTGWLEVDLGEEQSISRAYIAEIEWQNTEEFAIEYKTEGAWKELARGATIGTGKTIRFSPTPARYVRLNVLSAKGAININEFQLFAK